MSSKTVNQKAWWLVLPVVVLVGFNAIVPLMAVVNYSVQETFGNNRFFFEGVKWFDEVVHSPRFYGALRRQLLFTAIVLADRGAPRHGDRPRDAAPGRLGVRVPRADVDAAPDPVERGRRDLEHLRAPGHRAPRVVA